MQKANIEYGSGINPISRLIQIQQANRRREPIYTLVTEQGLPRRREFVIQVCMTPLSIRIIKLLKYSEIKPAALGYLRVIEHRNCRVWMVLLVAVLLNVDACESSYSMKCNLPIFIYHTFEMGGCCVLDQYIVLFFHLEKSSQYKTRPIYWSSCA